MEKRYNQFSTHLKEKFGTKVYKITLDAGFSCPNREGRSEAGCVFCDDGGSFSQAHSNLLSIENQIEEGVKTLSARFKAEKFMSYFQAYTNTYKPVAELEKIYSSALKHKDIVGISIGTRPDCVDEEKLDLISSYTKDYYTWVEYGLQSIHDKTLTRINRGHDFDCFLRAYDMTKSRGINVCAHVILGMWETHDEMMQTAQKLAELEVDGVKIHMLCALQNTKLAQMYENSFCHPEFISGSSTCEAQAEPKGGRFRVKPGMTVDAMHEAGIINFMDEKEYVQTVCDFLEYLSPKTTIHRLAGNGLSKNLIAPAWLGKKFDTLNQIDRELTRRDAFQGSKSLHSLSS